MKKSLTSLVVIFSCSKSGTPGDAGADRNGALGGDGIDGGWCFGVADGHAGGVRAQARSGVSRWRAGRGRTMGDAMPGPRKWQRQCPMRPTVLMMISGLEQQHIPLQ